MVRFPGGPYIPGTRPPRCRFASGAGWKKLGWRRASGKRYRKSAHAELPN
jgi:hypothetical protein